LDLAGAWAFREAAANNMMIVTTWCLITIHPQ
jgi:hypothetical protein